MGERARGHTGRNNDKVEGTSSLSVPRVLRTGGVSALTYGQETMGVSSTTLLAQRRAVAAALVTEGSGDLDLRLALADGTGKAKVDPAFAAHTAPIGSWAPWPHGSMDSGPPRTWGTMG